MLNQQGGGCCYISRVACITKETRVIDSVLDVVGLNEFLPLGILVCRLTLILWIMPPCHAPPQLGTLRTHSMTLSTMYD